MVPLRAGWGEQGDVRVWSAPVSADARPPLSPRGAALLREWKGDKTNAGETRPHPFPPSGEAARARPALYLTPLESGDRVGAGKASAEAIRGPDHGGAAR